MPNNFSRTLRTIAGHLARNCGDQPLEWLEQSFENFLYNWDCVTLSIEAENEAQKKAMDEAKSEAKKPTKDFDEWMSEVSKENAVSIKEHKYGIKRRKK